MRTVEEHLASAEELFAHRPDLAQIQATLALVGAVREVGGNLDSIRRPSPQPVSARDDMPLVSAAALLEGMAIGSDGEAREWTIAKLVLHSRSHYLDAERIAVSARDQTDEGTSDREAVEDAIELLGIAVAV